MAWLRLRFPEVGNGQATCYPPEKTPNIITTILGRYAFLAHDEDTPLSMNGDAHEAPTGSYFQALLIGDRFLGVIAPYLLGKQAHT
jgi:hypothetical protein